VFKKHVEELEAEAKKELKALKTFKQRVRGLRNEVDGTMFCD
jgi:hypothetical protein